MLNKSYFNLVWKLCNNKQAVRDAVLAQGGNSVVAAVNNPTNATFKIKIKKLFVAVATLSTEDDNKLL